MRTLRQKALPSGRTIRPKETCTLSCRKAMQPLRICSMTGIRRMDAAVSMSCGRLPKRQREAGLPLMRRCRTPMPTNTAPGPLPRAERRAGLTRAGKRIRSLRESYDCPIEQFTSKIKYNWTKRGLLDERSSNEIV